MLLAQISDTHILARDSDRTEGPSRAENLRLCVADINRQQPDAVIHTGDMVQNGLAGEYDYLRELLAPLKAPLYVIPGNRDRREPLRAAFSGLAYLPQEGEDLHYTIEDFPLRLVALDSTAAGERKGVYGARRQAWLQARLSEDSRKPAVLFIHHPPFDIGDHYLGGYRRPQEAEDLGAIVSRHSGIERLLCGHVHCPTQRPWAGTTATTMASVAVDVRKGVEAAVKDRPMYLLHKMPETGGLVSETRTVPGAQ